MTIVVGYRPKGSDRVWLASDTRTTGGDFVFPERARKLFRCGGWLIGSSGSSRLDEFWDVSGDIPGWQRITELRDDFMAYLARIGCQPHGRDDDKGEPPSYGFSLIAARRGELWQIASNGALVRPAWGFVACGSGQDFAYGAAYCAIKCDMGSQRGEDVVALAVSAAMEFRADCGGEIDIESVE